VTNEELTATVNKQSLSIAEINQALAHMTRNSLILHESIKSLETTAEILLESANKHEAAITNLEKQWQAYLSRQPRT